MTKEYTIEWMEMFTKVKHELIDIDSVVVLGSFDSVNRHNMIWIEQRTHRDDLWRWIIPNVDGAYGDCRTLNEAKDKSSELLIKVLRDSIQGT